MNLITTPIFDSTDNVEHRMICALATRGQLGKSLENIMRAEWFTQRKVDTQGFDLDGDHQTFYRTFPKWVQCLDLGAGIEAEELIISKILRKAYAKPVTLIDPRAHVRKIIMAAMRRVKFLAMARERNLRFTALLFPQDNIEVMDDISETVRELQNNVDWVVVKNLAKTTGFKYFEGSRIEANLRELGARFFEMPVLLTDTVNHLSKIEKQLHQAISPLKALYDETIPVDTLHRIILEDWMRTVFERYDQIASVLLPSADLTKLGQRRTEPTTEYKRIPVEYAESINTDNLD